MDILSLGEGRKDINSLVSLFRCGAAFGIYIGEIYNPSTNFEPLIAIVFVLDYLNTITRGKNKGKRNLQHNLIAR